MGPVRKAGALITMKPSFLKRNVAPLAGAAVVVVLVIVLCAVGPALRANVLLSLQLATLYVLFAVATNLLLGYAGLLSFGQAVFFGTGAYTVALLAKYADLPFLLVALLGILVPTVLSFLIGALALRARKFYFALLTLAFAQLFSTLARQFYDVTGGDTGMFGAMVPAWLSRPAAGFQVTLIVVVICVGLLWFVTHSPFGQSLRAIKENRQRAQALGINVYRHELIAFVITGAFTGIAGVLFAVGQQAAYPTLLDWQTSGTPLFMALIGGMNSFVGPVIGALVFYFGKSFLVTYTSHWQIFFGLLILLIVLFAPGGISGIAKDIWAKLRRRQPAADSRSDAPQPVTEEEKV